jgi:uncharacterized membrane protein YgcG
MVGAAARLCRVLLAVAMACSWLLLAGTPAGAFVTRATVESPKSGAQLKAPKPLVVAVERTTAPAEETITVRTQLFYGGTPAPPDPQATEQPPADGEQQPPVQLKPVSKKQLDLRLVEEKPADRQTGPASERLRFAGVVDPYNLAWLPQPGTGRNGQYTLKYLADSDRQDNEDWQSFEFTLDAPPPPQGAPGVGVQDAAAKRMVIAWQPNAAPDLTGYTVERRLGSGSWTVAADKVKAGQTQITDTVAAYGTYQYRVTAIRPRGDGSNTSRTTTSAASAPFALQPPVTVAPRGSSPGTGSSGDGSPSGDGSTGGTSTGGTSSGGTSSGGTSGGGLPDLPSSGSPSTSSGFGTQTEENPDAPDTALPRGFDDTFRGPLDYNVQQDEVTERVPVDVAQGGGGPEDGGTLTVLNRAIDQQRVLPPVAGGLILVISAAHVLRYLNE